MLYIYVEDQVVVVIVNSQEERKVNGYICAFIN